MYPIQLVGLAGQRVLVVGGGVVAHAKLEPLLHAQARVHLVAPELCPQIEARLPDIWRYDAREVQDDDVVGARLVLAATDDVAVNRHVAHLARQARVLVNAADDPEACDFFSPAVVRRGPLSIAIGTDGQSPLFAAQTRRLLEALLPNDLEDVAEFFTRLRARGLKGLAKKGTILRALTDPGLHRLIDRGERTAAEQRLDRILAHADEPFDPGTVAIVGAGPGSRALLTLRALDRIHRADVILHDALVAPEVLEEALPGTRLVDVGRRSGDQKPVPSWPALSSSIACMIREAKAGHRVVRLHGGDPLVFGRGGEEAQALDEHGIGYEIVSGVSAVLAAAAAADVPLTQRGMASGFSVRTGHAADGRTCASLPTTEETVVVLMALATAKDVMQQLINEGRPPDTPAVAISSATLARERVVKGTIADLPMRLEDANLEPPVTLIVGLVAQRARATEHEH